MTAVDSLRRALVGMDGLRFDPDAEPWRPDEHERDALRRYIAHIGAHPPVVGATPRSGPWPATTIGVGVTAFWDPARCRPHRWQQHVCRTILHDTVDRRANLAPTFVLLRDQLWLVGGHHELWLVIAARTAGLHRGPVTAYVHLPGEIRRPPPSLRCECPNRPLHLPAPPVIPL